MPATLAAGLECAVDCAAIYVKFTDITGRTGLLSQLLEHEVIAEREVVRPPFLGEGKFDVRAYTINYDMPHFIVRMNPASAEVTNYSQGAKVVDDPNTGLGEACRDAIRRLSLRAAEAMRMPFGGVDIMFHNDLDHPLVVEVQAFTGYTAPKKFDRIEYMLRKETGLFV
jgi:hypothetical protein